MKAAVVESFDRPPRYADFAEPQAGEGEVIVSVRAAALSQLVRGQASGRHYSSAGQLPIVPGVDGVGTLVDGKWVYFAFPKAPLGAMAERVAVATEFCVPLPDDLDDVTAAAAANPGMSSWAALTERARFERGESVLINGATGAAGRLAIQITRHLGAARIIATGRNAASESDLRSLGADAFIPLDLPPEELKAAFAKEIHGGLNVVLDYLFGPSAEAFFAAAGGHGGATAEPRIRYVNIGSIAGQSITLPAGALRSSGLELLGSGLGSVSGKALVRCIGDMLRAFKPAGFQIAADPVPLKEVQTAWNAKDGGRTVFTI